jgi:type II secretory pathway pseudopilin PulG
MTSKLRRNRSTGLTWTEVLVALAIVTTLFVFCWIAMSRWMLGNQMKSTLSNMKQLHLAAEAMALDGRGTKDPSMAWPGDIGGTYADWVQKLVPEYLHTNDFCKLLSAPGKSVPLGKFPPAPSQSAVLIYAVSSNSAPVTVFLSTANFTNDPHGGLPLSSAAKPYGNGGFVVMCKGGDGAMLPARKAGDARSVGSFAPMLK